ncbi:hypothetical protein N4T77_10990 [Clostridium sp. CX1]|uniref:Uncharacterized protein n=1 Tax=Clostridium tanneri TaxID=3037988 RepID=A0ABU4JW01_9CLOT|nr:MULTISPECIES: hypothetical protein [unclassified Clostridium]MCT8977130.1 hypothetical protein [Clostridium sp. CX1]MDW8802308.1 hypothetical protein [Clostridium sp. A1-XYC3]
MNLIQYVVAALIVEALWETTKLFWQNGKFSYDRVGSVAFGELVAIGANIDFMNSVGLPIHIPYVGMILTGILISRGSNFMHDLLENTNRICSKNKDS